MENPLKVLALSLAGIFAILFIVTTVLAFALYNVEQSIFDPDLYKQALEEEMVYQRLPELTTRVLTISAQKPEVNAVLSIFRNLSEEEWRGFVFGLFPPEVLRTLAEDTITQVMAYLNRESDQAVLSLTSLKTHLGSQEGVNVIYGMLRTQPDCTLEHLTAIVMGQEDIALCNPPETFLFVDLRPIYETEIRATVTLIPEQVTFISYSPEREQKLHDLENLRTIARLSPILPILCLFAVTLLAVRSLNDWLNWWGYPLLLAGFGSMFLSGLSRLLAALTFQAFVVPILPDAIPSDFVGVFKDLFASVVHNAVRPILLGAGIMALVGLSMVVIKILFREQFQKRPVYNR